MFILDILWYHNTTFLKNTDNVKISTNLKEMKSSCVILNATKEQVGFYICKAINDVSEVITRAKLDLASGGLSTTIAKAATEIDNVNTEAETNETKNKVIKVMPERKATLNKKSIQIQKTTKDENKMESNKSKSQAQKDIKKEIKTDVSAEFPSESTNKAHSEVIRNNERIENASVNIIDVTTRTHEIEDEVVEILEETEEIHVKIYKEVFSVEEMENFKVADEVNAILETIEAHQFGSGERPLRELATVGHLLRRGIEIMEIIQLYDANFFPALKLPESQSALVQLVERQGYENLIAEILHATSSEDENLLASTVGFRAFIRMVEVTKKPIEEIITNFKFEDFVSQEWKHKEVKDSESVEVKEIHVSSIRAEKISIIGKEFE